MKVKMLVKIVLVLFFLILIAGAYKYREKIGNRLLLSKFKKAEFALQQYPKPLLYRYYVPQLVEGNKYPLVLYLHGGGGRGTNNKGQINSRLKPLVDKRFQTKNPSIILAPQCPGGVQWVNAKTCKAPFDHYNLNEVPESKEMKKLVALINEYIKEFPVDTSRIYVTGFSMGSSGTWDILSRYPRKFAAAVPVAGVSDTTQGPKLTEIPIWAFTGSLDNLAPPRLNRNMVNAINSSGGKAKHTILENIGHSCYVEAMVDNGALEWMFSQSKQ